MPEKYGRVTRKPSWLKIKLHEGGEFARTAKLVKDHALHTICGSGRCPNQAECWSRGTATFMILGDVCTRSCRFCATKTGKPLPVDPDEPSKVADSVKIMGLKYCVLTSVDRDDLPDGGAAHWIKTVEAIREKCPGTGIEILIPDFNGNTELLRKIAGAGADVVGHNLETVERLTPLVRSRAGYRRSLEVIRYLSQCGVKTKSGLMVGLGEGSTEVLEAMDDLVGAGCRLLTIGQYLQPTRRQVEVTEYVHPDVFEFYKTEAFQRGFDYVESAPLVRSSYLAEKAAGRTCF